MLTALQSARGSRLLGGQDRGNCGEWRMNFDAERFGSFEVDHELESDGTWQRMADYIFSLCEFVGKGGGL